ncbi:hypothetical protein FGO68_gene10399 [Halteria grandinella]|uniref:Uncharacterized protein n=1 Tax=Halteria grandinella TaxID=5974 RepID=A0A8J8P166_HALGN|nr:hypothetical protein FGO68_gene10399 [Halteria grandinella]
MAVNPLTEKNLTLGNKAQSSKFLVQQTVHRKPMTLAKKYDIEEREVYIQDECEVVVKKAPVKQKTNVAIYRDYRIMDSLGSKSSQMGDNTQKNKDLKDQTGASRKLFQEFKEMTCQQFMKHQQGSQIHQPEGLIRGVDHSRPSRFTILNDDNDVQTSLENPSSDDSLSNNDINQMHRKKDFDDKFPLMAKPAAVIESVQSMVSDFMREEEFKKLRLHSSNLNPVILLSPADFSLTGEYKPALLTPSRAEESKKSSEDCKLGENFAMLFRQITAARRSSAGFAILDEDIKQLKVLEGYSRRATKKIQITEELTDQLKNSFHKRQQHVERLSKFNNYVNNPIARKHYVDSILDLLKIGIRVEKFHYSKQGSKVCTLRLSEDFRAIYWEYDDQKLPSRLMDRQLKLREVENVMYGPQSFTFRYYKFKYLTEHLEWGIEREKAREAKKKKREEDQLSYSSDEDYYPHAPAPKYYAWQVVSLKSQERTLDFAIQEESLMVKFLQAMNLVTQVVGKNGNRNRSKSKEDVNKAKRQNSNSKIDIELNTRAKLMPGFIYKLMRIKMKIAYHAQQKQMSITEYFVTALIKTYRELREDELKAEGIWDEFMDEDFGDDLKMQIEFTMKMKNLMAIGNAFQTKVQGFATLQKIRAKLMYSRLKFERYIAMQWDFGVNPCLYIPDELRISFYPQSYQYYDSVPLIFAKYIIKRVTRGRVVDAFGLILKKKTMSLRKINSGQKAREMLNGGGRLFRCFSPTSSKGKRASSTPADQMMMILQQIKETEKARQQLLRENTLSEVRPIKSKGTPLIKRSTMIKAYLKLLSQLQEMEGEEFDAQKLLQKQLHMRQLMGLKYKGRYLEETKLFEMEVKQLPSLESQQKVREAFEKECLDRLYDVILDISHSTSVEQRHSIVNTQIYKEYFYFNPIYNSLLAKRSQVLDRCNENEESAKLFMKVNPNLRMGVTYHRKRQCNWVENQRRNNDIDNIYKELTPAVGDKRGSVPEAVSK